MARAITTIKNTGPFFEKDPVKTFRQNIRVMMAAIAAEGEADVRAQLESGNARRLPVRQLGDHVSDHVVGRVQGIPERGGHKWQVTAVISVNNSGLSKAGGISLMAASSSVEGRVHAFRKTRGRLGRAKDVNTAELMKGVI